jgi:hypothetical protein
MRQVKSLLSRKLLGGGGSNGAVKVAVQLSLGPCAEVRELAYVSE